MSARLRRAVGTDLLGAAARTVPPLLVALSSVLLLGACSGPQPAASDSPAVNAPGANPSERESLPAEPVTFFRAQAPACRAYAKQRGVQQVEAARFTGASLVDSLGGGAYLIRDGFDTRLVVRPAERVVLPESGRDTDPIPTPYGAGCPPEVFKGSAP